MHSRYSLALTILLALMPLSTALAGSLEDDVRTRLQAPDVLRGHFNQSKTVAGFKRPLLARGDFLLWRGHGVIWHTRSPFDATLILTPRKLVSQQGESVQQMDTRQEPALHAMNETLLALLASDLDTLQQRFHIDGELHARDWQLQLMPRDTHLAAIIRQIDLGGDSYVRKVRLSEGNGDISLITFDALATTPPPTSRETGQLND